MCVGVIILLLIGLYIVAFYPHQSMPIGEPVFVRTIDSAKYHNDCLHPCIRYSEMTGKYYMAQSPYYAWNNKVENPMFYFSHSYKEWIDGALIADTPEMGYNSDPNICICENGEIIYLWRECDTPLCDSLECTSAIVGGMIDDGQLKHKLVYCINYSRTEDIEQCPTVIEHGGVRCIYAGWYQYEPERKNRGVSIWHEDVNYAKGGGHMNRYQLVDTVPFESCYTVDKCAQVRAFGHIIYFPKPLYHDLWHFDLFEYAGKLYMVSVAEKGDNIMLSVSDDWKNFKTFRKPLVNNHYTENYCGYRQYYYKPTAFIKADTLHLFYIANAKDDSNRNQLYHTEMSVEQLIK